MIVGVKELSDSQINTIRVTSQVASVFSLVGCTFIFSTFLCSSRFRKPVNRLIFYASLGNLSMNVATLMSQVGIEAGADSPLCQLQGFLIQMFLPADALWNLSLAVNVYLTVFRNYNAERLRSLEWIYHLVNYGGTFLVAFIYCFISTDDRGKVYGPAVLWCWIRVEWDFLRIALVYGPAWICILVTFIIYLAAGLEIFKKRNQLRSFRNAPAEVKGVEVENPFASYKSTEIHITSELAVMDGRQSAQNSQSRFDPENKNPSQNCYEQYSITIERGPMSSNVRPRVPPTLARRQTALALEANTAAWGYTKCAALFFVSLLITWVPSSLNRVYPLVYPGYVSWEFSYAAGLVLPLMGFWNAVIYTTTSWHACKMLFSHPRRPPSFLGCDQRTGRPRSLSSVRVSLGPQRTNHDHTGASDSVKRLAP